MDYSEYKQYRKTLPGSLFYLDDLNPYPLLASMSVLRKQVGQELIIGTLGGYIKQTTGVRELLKYLFSYFNQLGCVLVLPEDIYPVYFELVAANHTVYRYRTHQQEYFKLPESEKAVLLIANPLVPEGKYLTALQVKHIDTWLNESSQRWLLIDAVYDYLGRSMQTAFKSNNIICMASLSKLALRPGLFGWAVARKKLTGFDKIQLPEVRKTYALILQQAYRAAWDALEIELRELRPSWCIPEVGYITTVQMNYIELLNDNIAALPGSVFGIQQKNVSVISCLAKLKETSSE